MIRAQRVEPMLVDGPRGGVNPSIARRALDICFASVALVLGAPLMAVIALCIWVTSGAPVIYKHLRVGQGGRPFSLYKFRTMTTGHNGSDLTGNNDARVTSVGRVLRKSSLDELPQLVNVLKGDMTLVGPRPEAVGLAARYPEPFDQVFDHRPGVTGPVQLYLRDTDSSPYPVPDPEAYYLDVMVPTRVAVDYEFLSDPSFIRTLGYVGRTFGYVARRALGGGVSGAQEARDKYVP